MLNSQSILFQPTKIGPLSLKNHFMRSPCYMNGCDPSGKPKAELLKYYKDLSDGQMGLIVTEYMALSEAGRSQPGQAMMTSKANAECWRSSIDYIHQNGSKIIAQLSDAGARGLHPADGRTPRGPSAFLKGSREMTSYEIARVIENYRNAAKWCQEAGFDGIEIHGAHGYLISQFLSPYANHRTDNYGGSDENRRRIVKEIAQAVRGDCGKDFFVGLKLNVTDALKKGGVEISHAIDNIKALKGDIDLFELSHGFWTDKFEDCLPMPQSTVEASKAIRDAVPDAKLANAWKQTNFKDMDQLVNNGTSDLISFGRAAICDTHVVEHLYNGDEKVKCLYCGDCLDISFATMAYCPLFKK